MAGLQNIYQHFMRLPLFMRATLCLAAGAACSFALPPYSQIIWAILGLSCLYYQTATLKSGRQALLFGWLFGFGYFSLGLRWIANALLVEGNPYSWVWPLAVAGLPALLSVFTGLAVYISYTLKRKLRISAGSIPAFILFACVFSALEWVRGHIFTGFPWNLYGYIWSDILPIAQLAALGGIYTLTLLTIVWACLPGFLILPQQDKSTKLALTAFGLLTVLASYSHGSSRLNQAPTTYNQSIQLSVIQPNILQEDKWAHDKATRNFLRHISLTKKAVSATKTSSSPHESSASTSSAHTYRLIIWPETALTQRYLEHPSARQELRNAMNNVMGNPPAGEVFLFTGLLRSEPTTDGQNARQSSAATAPTRYYNSLAVFNEELETVALYNKSHLVPFGEFIPFQDWLPLAPFVQLTGFTPGTGNITARAKTLPPFRPLVCYEIIFPAQSAPKKNQQPPLWIVNVTNDAWYGKSAGPYQHYAQAQFRAIEQGLPVVRSANTGISGIIDPMGRSIAKSPLYETAILTTALPTPLTKRTFYSRYGDYIYMVISILAFTAVFFTALINRGKNL